MITLTLSDIEKELALNLLLGLSIIFLPTISSAQTPRDPTLPPVLPLVVQNAGNTALIGSSLSISKDPPAIIVRQGRRYVVLESNLYAQGQSYGDIRIERIGETEVWFREHNILYKIPRFPGVRRNMAVSGEKSALMSPVPKQTVP